MKKKIVVLVLVTLLATALFAQGQAEKSGPTSENPLVLRYAHMNPASSPNGLQATYFADKVAEKTGGAIKIEVYPASQLGSISEMAEAVSMGSKKPGMNFGLNQLESTR